MSKEICETKIVWVSWHLVEIYQLVVSDGKYSIICDEKDVATGRESMEVVSDITDDKKIAHGIFKTIIDNKVCEGTLKDVIHDLMC